MKNTVTLSILLFLVAANCNAQYGGASGLVLFTGIVVGSDSTTVISDVHLYNQNNQYVGISDRDGFFSMFIARDHVVRFSAVGYQPLYFSMDKAFQGELYYESIVLLKRTTALSEVTVYGKKQERHFLEQEEPEKPFGEYGIGVNPGPPRPIDPTLANPISMLYELFSKDGKERKKVEQLEKDSKTQKQIDARFEQTEIWEMTGLFGKKMKDFQSFCSFPSKFVLNASDYDFLIAVRYMFRKYQQKGS